MPIRFPSAGIIALGLTFFLCAGPATATPLSYSVEGTLYLQAGTDDLGLHQSAFAFNTTPGEFVSHNEPHTLFEAGERSISLDGLVGAALTPHRIAQDTWTTDGGSYDALRFGGSHYSFGTYELVQNQISIHFDAGMLPAGPDHLPLFGMADVQGLPQVRFDVWMNNLRTATYYSVPGSLRAAAAAAVTEPAMTGLFVLGLFGLLGQRAVARGPLVPLTAGRTRTVPCLEA